MDKKENNERNKHAGNYLVCFLVPINREQRKMEENIMTTTTTYNYLEAMKQDVKEYIEENINVTDYETKEDLEEYLNDTLWTEDSVTGNASGSYTFNRATAKKYVDENKNLVNDMMKEFDCKDKVANWWIEDNYEAIDVSIRCYFLGQAISEVLEKIEF